MLNLRFICEQNCDEGFSLHDKRKTRHLKCNETRNSEEMLIIYGFSAKLKFYIKLSNYLLEESGLTPNSYRLKSIKIVKFNKIRI